MPAVYTWRAATAADLPALHALKTTIFQADGEPLVRPLADLEREFDDAWSPPATHTRVAVARDGTLAAYGRLFVPPAPGATSRADLTDDVHPAHRSQGLTDTLLHWLVTRSRAVLADFNGPRHIGVHVSDHLTGRVAAYRRHGFTPSFTLIRMRRSLHQPLPHCPLPPGFTLTPYTPEWDEAARVAQNEVFSEHPLQDQISRADWQTYYLESSAARLDLTYFILAGSEIAAYCLNRVHATENTRPGQTTAWVHTLGTRRPWRKQGLAAHLLMTAFAAFQAAGFDYATLDVEADNTTGARRLYERLGFVPVQYSTEYIIKLP